MGDIIIANECANQDYFWAMRGGGGSTYGVALSYVIKAFPEVHAARYATTLYGWTEITHWYKNWGKIAMIGGSGYFNGYPARPPANVSLEFVVPGMNEDQLAAVVDPIMESMPRRRASRPNIATEAGDEEEGKQNNGPTPGLSYARQRGIYSYYENVGDVDLGRGKREKQEKRDVQNAEAAFPGMGANKIIASWLWSTDDLANPAMPQALRAAFDADAQMLNDATVGIGTHNPPYIRGGGNAVNPAFRTATMRPATELQWASTDSRLLAKKEADALRFTNSYRSLSPSGGTYANEAFWGTPYWQHAFWGRNYARLLDIKKRVDPWGVFYCR
jgi:Berberine and berberine like